MADELIYANYVTCFLPPGQTGPKAEKYIINMFFSAFPDLQGTPEDLVTEGDRVAVRIAWRGTNTGSLMGMPPTHTPVSFGVSNILWVVNGKIAVN